MKRTILSCAALLAAAIALAGCGGSTSASDTQSTVAGAHHAKAAGSTSGNFSASVHGFEGRLQTSVSAFQKGNIAAAASSAGSLLSNCSSTVNNKIAPRATTAAQTKAVTHLRAACSDMSKATHAGMSGSMTKAKQFAQAALDQSQIAAKLSG